MSNYQKKEKLEQKPDLTAYTVKDRKGRKIWRREGVAFKHKEGEGLTALIDFFGQEIELIFLPYQEPEKQESESATPSPN